MAERLTVSQIRAMYEAIAEENKTLPNFDEVDFETKWQMIELLNREILGIDTEQGPGDGKTIDEKIEELEALIETLRVYDQAGFFEGKPEESQVLYRYVSCRRVNVPENFAGSIAKCVVEPTSDYVITIYKNSTEIGTITFSEGVNSGVFDTIGGFTLEIGDTLTLIAPETADNTFETLIFNLKLTWAE